MRGLNRVEVMIILFVGLVMMAVAVPWLLTSRSTARDHQCSSNLQQLHIAFDSYTVFYKQRFPYGTHINPDLPAEKRFGWTVGVLPFLKEQRQYAFDLSKPWDAAVNKQLALRSDDPKHACYLFRCPDDDHNSSVADPLWSSYVGMTGLGADSPSQTAITPNAGLWGYNRQSRFVHIADGREHTVNLLETGHNNGPWTAGGQPTLRPLLTDEAPLFGPGRQFGGHHAEGTQALFADGAVKMLNNAMDAPVFEKLCTIAGK